VRRLFGTAAPSRRSGVESIGTGNDVSHLGYWLLIFDFVDVCLGEEGLLDGTTLVGLVIQFCCAKTFRHCRALSA